MAPDVSVAGDLEDRAERLYGAVVRILKDRNMMGLLSAVGDAKDGIAWNDTSSKTRAMFRMLIVNANLTGGEPPR